jgi:hypothetical protein
MVRPTLVHNNTPLTGKVINGSQFLPPKATITKAQTRNSRLNPQRIYQINIKLPCKDSARNQTLQPLPYPSGQAITP